MHYYTKHVNAVLISCLIGASTLGNAPASAIESLPANATCLSPRLTINRSDFIRIVANDLYSQKITPTSPKKTPTWWRTFFSTIQTGFSNKSPANPSPDEILTYIIKGLLTSVYTEIDWNRKPRLRNIPNEVIELVADQLKPQASRTLDMSFQKTSATKNLIELLERNSWLSKYNFSTGPDDDDFSPGEASYDRYRPAALLEDLFKLELSDQDFLLATTLLEKALQAKPNNYGYPNGFFYYMRFLQGAIEELKKNPAVTLAIAYPFLLQYISELTVLSPKLKDASMTNYDGLNVWMMHEHAATIITTLSKGASFGNPMLRAVSKKDRDGITHVKGIKIIVTPPTDSSFQDGLKPKELHNDNDIQTAI